MHGYVYGNDRLVCHKCGSKYLGDKKSIHCESCAFTMWKDDISASVSKPVTPIKAPVVDESEDYDELAELERAFKKISSGDVW